MDKWIQLQDSNNNNLYPTSKMDLLWTNSSPSSSFSAQAISLDFSIYKIVYVLFAQNTTTMNIDIATYLTNDTVTVKSIDSKKIVIRNVYKNDSVISFSDASIIPTYGATSTTTNNSILIPYKIYGIK